LCIKRIPGASREVKIWGLEPSVRGNAAYRQITLAPVFVFSRLGDVQVVQKTRSLCIISNI